MDAAHAKRDRLAQIGLGFLNCNQLVLEPNFQLRTRLRFRRNLTRRKQSYAQKYADGRIGNGFERKYRE